STVATSTEIHDYLRLLFARAGVASCHVCGQPIRQQSLQQIQDALMALPEGTKLMLLAPLVRGRKGQHAEVFEHIRKAGQVRVRVDGTVYDLEQTPPLDGRAAHTIEAVVDRIVIREGSRGRLAESLALAVKQGEGVVVAAVQGAREQGTGDRVQDTEWDDRLFSTLYACPNCRTSIAEIEPRTFSFNSPYGACPACDGLGYKLQFDPDLVVPDISQSIAGGAVAAWRTKAATSGRGSRKMGTEDRGQETGDRRQGTGVRSQREAVAAFLESQQTSLDTPLTEMRRMVREKLFAGDGKEFLGLLTLLEQEYSTATDAGRREELESFRGHVTCVACGGARLRPEALGVRIGGQNIADICRLGIAEAREFFCNLTAAIQNPKSKIQNAAGEPRPLATALEAEIAAPILHEVSARLGFLEKVGLEYLTLDRPSDTLSGGELQRVRLASGIGSGLAGILYILDEPSIGLHPRDNQRLIDALRDLQAGDSTVLVVEHDEAIMRQADWLIDIGPGAGSRGGSVVAEGTPAEVMAGPDTITGRYLAGALSIPIPAQRRKAAKSRSIVIEGVTTNNLQNVTATFPLACLIGISGVSGSGKSSLINETLAPALVRRLGGMAPKPGPHTALRGVSQIDKVIAIDQSPLGRSPRSNAATYTGALDEIRKVFAGTKEARQLGFKANRFSF
ncbi:MAG TPA: ABC-ATPase UvrA, partial [Pirellulaceae bacterium]|nr:ABC-ATPase UvrA [Pirellulaceae bacterium]